MRDSGAEETQGTRNVARVPESRIEDVIQKHNQSHRDKRAEMSCAEKGEERKDTKKPPVLVGPKGRGAIPPAKEVETIHPFAIRNGVQCQCHVVTGGTDLHRGEVILGEGGEWEERK